MVIPTLAFIRCVFYFYWWLTQHWAYSIKTYDSVYLIWMEVVTTSDNYIETEAAGFKHSVSNFVVEPFSVLTG